MRMPRLTLHVLFAVAALLVWLGSAQAASVEEQRRLFLQAEEALLKGQRHAYLSLLPRLDGYPLTPYLAATDLERRLGSGSTAEVRAFLKAYGDIPASDSLRRKWLRELAKQARWADFLQDYTPQTNEDLLCLYGQAL